MQIEGITELVDLRLVRAFRAEPADADRMGAEAIALQPGVEVAQGLLADAAHPARRQLHAAPATLDITLLLQLRGKLAHLVGRLACVGPQQLLELLRLLRCQLPALVSLAQRRLQVLDSLQPLHQRERLLQRQGLRTIEGVAAAKTWARR